MGGNGVGGAAATVGSVCRAAATVAAAAVARCIVGLDTVNPGKDVIPL
jgi:hypothetical protein